MCQSQIKATLKVEAAPVAIDATFAKLLGPQPSLKRALAPFVALKVNKA